MLEGRRRLTISHRLQIGYKEDGTAWYWVLGGAEPQSVEAEVQSWLEFVSGWLEAFQPPPRPKPYSAFEQTLLKALVNIRRMSSPAWSGLSAAEIETKVREVVEESAKVLTRNTDISTERISEIVSEVLARPV